MTMRARIYPALAALAALGLAVGAADAHGAKVGKPKAVKAVAAAGVTGGVATATATCPVGNTPKGPWRAVSGGFDLQSGDGIVFESRRIGQRSWRASAQSMSGAVSLAAYVYCQRGVPKQSSVSFAVATPGAAQVGPAATAKCNTGSAVHGGFSTPLPFTLTGARNTVIGSFPSGKRAWRVQVVSSQASTVTSFVYCAKRKKPRTKNAKAESTSVATTAGSLAVSETGLCSAAQFSPGGGGFFQTGATPTEYLVPVKSTQRPSTPASNKPLPPGYKGSVWRAHGLKVGNTIPVRITAVALCG
jgi:hypothetical protein